MIVGYINTTGAVHRPNPELHPSERDLMRFGQINDSQCFIGGPTNGLEEIKIRNGTFDHLHLEAGRSSMGNKFLEEKGRQERFTMRSIILMHFRGNFEGGSIEANDYTIQAIQMARRVFGSFEKWETINQFAYNPEKNLYTTIDRTPLANIQYEYSFIPLAHEWVGTPVESNPVSVSYTDMFLTDAKQNIPVRYNINISPIQNNSIMGTMVPLNGRFPIVSFGNSNYRTGMISFMPLTKQTLDRYGASVDGNAEYINRRAIVNWLMNGQAKIFRMGNVNYLVVTHDIIETPVAGGITPLTEIAMNYTEIGEINFNNMVTNGLLADVQPGNLTFDEEGNIIISQGGGNSPWQ